MHTLVPNAYGLLFPEVYDIYVQVRAQSAREIS